MYLQARREPRGARETIITGPSQPHYAGVEKGGNVGRVSPHHPTRGLREHRKLPERGPVRGGAPAENGFYAYLRSERRHLEHFSVFFSAGVPPSPQTSRGPGKLSPPSRQACVFVAYICM